MSDLRKIKSQIIFRKSDIIFLRRETFINVLLIQSTNIIIISQKDISTRKGELFTQFSRLGRCYKVAKRKYRQNLLSTNLAILDSKTFQIDRKSRDNYTKYQKVSVILTYF